MNGVRENAPDEIQADLDTVADGFAEVREIFEEYDYDLAKLERRPPPTGSPNGWSLRGRGVH